MKNAPSGKSLQIASCATSLQKPKYIKFLMTLDRKEQQILTFGSVETAIFIHNKLFKLLSD